MYLTDTFVYGKLLPKFARGVCKKGDYIQGNDKT